MIQRRVEELWRSRDGRALLFLTVLGAICLWFAYLIRGILGPFLIAIVLAFLLNPIVNWAERRKVPRAVSVLALYAVMGLLVAATVYFLVPLVVAEFRDLQEKGPAIAQYLQDLVTRRQVVSIFGVQVDLRQSYETAMRNLPGVLAGHLQSVLDNFFKILNWLFQLLLVLLVAFFLVKDAHAIRAFMRELVPQGFRADATTVAHQIYRMLCAYMRGQLAICGLVGVVTFLAMWAVGVPYSLALGIIAGVTAFIPFIGPFLGALPAIAMAAFVSQSVGKVVLVLVVYTVISNIIYNFISPKVYGDAVHLSPMLIIFAFVAGGYLGGILGLFLAVPVAAIARILFLYMHERVYA
jgi:predicted PurR-regulated permease PerM